MELPLTHPELYEDIGIKPPKVGGRMGGRKGRREAPCGRDPQSCREPQCCMRTLA